MRRCCLLLVCLLLLTGCGRADTQDVSFAPAEGDRLVIFTSHKETIYEPILKEFEQRTGIWVELETGGTVTLLERIAAGKRRRPDVRRRRGQSERVQRVLRALCERIRRRRCAGIRSRRRYMDALFRSAGRADLQHQARAAESARALGRPARRGLARAHRLCRPDRFRLELHRARHPFCRPSAATPTTPSPRSSAILTDASSPTAAAWSPPWQTAAATSA